MGSTTKFLTFTDLHIHNFKAFNIGNSRVEWQIKVLDLMFAVAHKYSISYILFEGDLFHQPKAVPTIVINRTVSKFKELFEKYPDITFVTISGNHDHATENTIASPAETSQQFLATVFDRFWLIDNHTIIIDDVAITGIPYYEYPEDFAEVLGQVESQLKRKHILMMHQTPQEVEGAARMQVDTTVHDEAFREFDLVLNGHIHKPEVLTQDFLNIGSPNQQTRSDSGYDCGFYILELHEVGFTYEFKSLNSRFPVFIDVEVGEDPQPYKEEIDYITSIPKIVPVEGTVTEEDVEKFRSDRKAADLIQSYVDELNESELAKNEVTNREKLLKTGINLID